MNKNMNSNDGGIISEVITILSRSSLSKYIQFYFHLNYVLMHLAVSNNISTFHFLKLFIWLSLRMYYNAPSSFKFYQNYIVYQDSIISYMWMEKAMEVITTSRFPFVLEVKDSVVDCLHYKTWFALVSQHFYHKNGSEGMCLSCNTVYTLPP